MDYLLPAGNVVCFVGAGFQSLLIKSFERACYASLRKLLRDFCELSDRSGLRQLDCIELVFPSSY